MDSNIIKCIHSLENESMYNKMKTFITTLSHYHKRHNNYKICFIYSKMNPFISKYCLDHEIDYKKC